MASAGSRGFPRRVSIVGGPGSGKSTLARRLGQDVGLPVYHMDKVHWKPGWVERSRDEKIQLARDILKRDSWILDGNMSATYQERFARSDVVIWLDLPVSLRLWRVTRRSVQWVGKVRPDMQDDCPERLGAGMLEFYRFIWRTRHSARQKHIHAMKGGSFTLCHIAKPADARSFSLLDLR